MFGYFSSGYEIPWDWVYWPQTLLVVLPVVVLWRDFWVVDGLRQTEYAITPRVPARVRLALTLSTIWLLLLTSAAYRLQPV